SIHARLVTWPAATKPLEHVFVQPDRDCPLGRRHNDFSLVPEVSRKVRQLGRRRTPDLGVADPTESGQISSASTWTTRFTAWLSRRSFAHGDCSFGLR